MVRFGSQDQQTTRRTRATREPRTLRLVMSVIDGELLMTYPLPPSGTVTIGRARDGEVCLADSSISRRHATLTVGPALTIEDLGSVNGTKVGGVQLATGERRTLAVGEMVELGSVDMVIRVADEDWSGRDHASLPRDGRALVAPIASAGHRLRGSDEPTSTKLDPVVIRDPAIVRIHRMAERVAVGRISVLLLGETGTGKEVLAEVIHNHSPRRDKPFLRLNCAALSEDLLESELFGHEKGAFSGAIQTKPGLLESTDGGTIFLDEVGEMPLSLQAKLLRVLQERKVLRVGSVKPRAIDVRFVSATNRDLQEQVRRGMFRQDLFFRLNGISLTIPPLRKRPSEIEPLALLFLQSAASDAGLPAPPRISAEALAWLRRYGWPGNVRELCNVMERALLLCGRGAEITLEHLQQEALATEDAPARVVVGPPAAEMPVDFRRAKAQVVAAFERSYLRQLLCSAHGNLSLAARLSQKDRSALNRLVKKHGISAHEFRDETAPAGGHEKDLPS